MKSNTNTITGAAALLFTALSFALAPSAHATEPTYPNLNYRITLTLTPALEASMSGPFSLDLQLVQGSGNVINTVTLSNFIFAGETASNTPDYTNGAATGSFATSVVLTNTDSDNELAAAFTSGVTSITFNVSETPNSEVVTSGTPYDDQFNVAVLDNGLNNLPTTDPSGGNALVISTLSSSETVGSVETYSSVSPDAGVTATVTAVPEPSTLPAIVAGLAFMALLGIRRRVCKA
jgi:hypothetical protein